MEDVTEHGDGVGSDTTEFTQSTLQDKNSELQDPDDHPVYSFYTRIENEKKLMTCNGCGKRISRGSDKGKDANTSNLVNHLKVKSHPYLHSEYCKKKEEYCEQQQLKKMNSMKKASTSMLLKQQSLKDLFSLQKKWPPDSIQSKELDKRIIEMIAVGNYPFTIVKELGFLRVVNYLNPQAQLKSDKFYRDQLNDTYKAVATKIEGLIKDVKYISFTTDIWTNNANTESLISLTAHYVDFSSALRPKVVLAARPLKADHTGETIADFLTTETEKWGIHPEKLHAIVHDNGSNVVRAVALTELFQSVRCFAHTLQLAIEDAINCQRAVIDIIAIAKSVVGHFSRSEQARRRLRDIQSNQNLKILQLKQCVSTRWNSYYLMLERLLEVKDALLLYESRFGLPNSLTPHQWKLAQSVCSVLYLFFDVTKEISYDIECSSVIIPFVKNLTNIAEQNNEEHKGVGTMKLTLANSLKERFANAVNDKNLILSTFLDPRFKCKYFDQELIVKIEQWIQEDLPIIPSATGSEEIEAQGTEAEPKKNSYGKTTRESIWELEAKYAQSSNHTPLTEEEQAIRPRLPSSSVLGEIRAYMEMGNVESKTNIFQWWKDSHFVQMKSLVLKYLSSPATSVPSEQLFSTAGEIYDDNRYRLLGDNAEKLLFLNKNLLILNFNY